MPQTQLSPGHGYIIRERLGRGRWKEVYRAVYKQEWHDRALAVFIDQPSTEKLLEELDILHRLTERPPVNVARIYGPFMGDDGQVYLAEELLRRPLDALCPLRSGEQFLRIARDLCMGLAALHELEPPLVHRDLKLDNCGVDYSGQAKIFDLGSVTSEPGSVKGTTLTRAPELFQAVAQCRKETDVWALGAVLFALRSEHYPFVQRSEANSRPVEGPERERFEQEVSKRALGSGAEADLFDRVREIFPMGAQETLVNMLAFDPARRPTARQAGEEWEELLRSWVRPGNRESVNPQAAAHELAAYMRAVLAKEVGMSAMQWEKVIKGIAALKDELEAAQLADLESLRARIKALRESGALR
jgi:serine/threonine protein kinase